MSEGESDGNETQAVLEELQQLPICDAMEACDPRGLGEMAKLGSITHVGSGHTLFTRGATADTVRFVLAGRVALTFDDDAGKTMTVGTASAGDLLGWSALRPGDAQWTVTARTTKPTRILCFDGKALRALCDRERDFGYCLMQYVFEAVAHRLADVRLQLLDVYGRADPATD